ncbi:MAG: AraC family transcriptional regulator [Deltaproteobacteria bacterium]|nr:AraC family transcriptional regulator [Deltaproteobacteria bacterium]
MQVIEVSAKIGAAIVHAAGRHGAALQAATGFDVALAADPDARITLTLETQLWDQAARLTGDDAFGLHAAEGIRQGSFDVLDYAVRTAPTLLGALERLVRYNRLVHDAAVFSLHPRPGQVAAAADAHADANANAAAVRIEHALRIAGARQSRHAAEFTVASLIVIGGQMLGQRLHARAAELTSPAPASPAIAAEHARVLGVAPRWGQRVNALELPRAALEQPLVAADPALSSVIERHAEALLARRPAPGDTTAERVRRLLAEVLGQAGQAPEEGAASLAAVAARLHASERSVQRRLADEGTSFDALLDEVRHGLALQFLGDPRIAIAEVAFLLGYSEPSAFHRAFKRWTGKTPSELRRRAA